MKSVFPVLLALNVALAKPLKVEISPKLFESFNAILTLEDLYFNEHGAYAPDLRTLRSQFEVKDSLEYFVPDYEIYVSIREKKPLLYAVDQSGDSIVQVEKGPPYHSPLKQNEYRADSWWGISLKKPLEVRIAIEPGQSFNGKILSAGMVICRFSIRNGKRPSVNGCEDFLSAKGEGNTQELEIVLPSTLLRAGSWEALLIPSRPGKVKGTFASQGARQYPIRGSISKKQPLKISGNP